ncbi:MAG: hypothetical protein R3B06_21000 [Kofleriaceae bacterium]
MPASVAPLDAPPHPPATRWLARMIGEPFHRDDEGRLLRECRTPAPYLRPDDLEHKVCPYAGSRRGHPLPMNVAALRQVGAHWDALVDTLALVRQGYVAVRGPGPLDVMDLWRVSQLGSALPWFFILRPSGGGVAPAFAAALAKATQGVGVWAQRVLVERVAGGGAVPVLTAADIVASSEATGTLVGETEVCAGSEAMLARFFEALVAGAPTLTAAPVRALAEQLPAVLRFGAHYANLKLVLWLHSLARLFVYADLAAALGPTHPLAPDVAALLEAGCEPSDFFTVGPPDLAAVPPPARAAWLGALARLVVPMAPDGSDRPLGLAAQAIARAGGVVDGGAALVDEVAAAGVDPAGAARAARAVASAVELDRVLAIAAEVVEAGLRGTDPDGGHPPGFGPAERDRLLAAPPRAVLARVAPVTFAAASAPG